MSAAESAKKKIAFSLNAPNAQSVALAGSFDGWEQRPTPLKKQKNGLWRTTLSLAPGTYEYRFLVDGQWCDDPECSNRVPNTFGTENCLRVVE
ncbi:MAG: isoamylase early set domain-containing protein [Verrucomicrobia bacterium]|nr:isoamylase early set domain-containing protein [Verrucomicrobiota bacterium]